MTDSSIFQRHANRTADSVVENLRPEDEQLTNDFGCFGWLRGSRERAVMLELRKKNGDILAIGYHRIDEAEFDPSEGITLHTPTRRIQIKGRHLNAEVRPAMRLFEGITRHRVPWVREAGEPERMEASAEAPFVEAIEW
jgi:hypothetical protein